MKKSKNPEQWKDRLIEVKSLRARDLLDHPLNPKIHPDTQKRPLEGLLSEIGKVDILRAYYSERNGGSLTLWDGHCRRELRIDEMWQVGIYSISDAEADLLLASFDPIGWAAEQSRARLETLMQGINTGNAELQKFLSEQAEAAGIIPPMGEKTPGAGGDDFDTTPDEEQTRVSYGDLWACGEHRVLCGDSTKVEDVARAMAGQKAAFLFTSPPYAAQREYMIGKFNWDALMDGVFLSVFENMAPDASVLVNLGLAHKDGRVNRYWDGWINRMESAGNTLYGWYVWDQGWGLPGDWAGRLAPSFEFVFHFARVPRHTRKTEQTLSAGKIRNSTFRQANGTLKPFTGNGEPTGTMKVADSVIRINRQIGAVEGGDHPAVFSVDFPAHCIPIWTSEQEIVYEPFGGSGTTLIACERTNRSARLIEIEPKYVNVILSRWEAETGRQAKLLDRID